MEPALGRGVGRELGRVSAKQLLCDSLRVLQDFMLFNECKRLSITKSGYFYVGFVL